MEDATGFKFGLASSITPGWMARLEDPDCLLSLLLKMDRSRSEMVRGSELGGKGLADRSFRTKVSTYLGILGPGGSENLLL